MQLLIGSSLDSLGKMNHNNLNRKLYPIFGIYQESKGKIKPYEQLKLWSKMGYHIDEYIINNKISSKSKLLESFMEDRKVLMKILD